MCDVERAIRIDAESHAEFATCRTPFLRNPGIFTLGSAT